MKPHTANLCCSTVSQPEISTKRDDDSGENDSRNLDGGLEGKSDKAHLYVAGGNSAVLPSGNTGRAIRQRPREPSSSCYPACCGGKGGRVATAHLCMHARVSRGKGGSIVATAAYNGRCRLVDEQTGEVWDYRHLGAAEFSGIYAPKGAPEWANDLQRLVNQIERTEKRADAQLGFNLDIALPCEMTLEQNRRLGQDFAREEWQRKGYAVVVDIHRPDPEGDPRNWHMHVWGTLRKIGPDGFARTKGEQQENYRNRHEYVEELRQKWERLANRHLERNGYDARIDMRSLKDQGIDREPEQHRGPTVTAIERENRASTVVVEIDQWRKDIAEERALLAEDRQLAAAEKQIEAQIIDLQAKRAEREAREAAKGQVEDIRPLDDQKSRPQDAPEAVQGQYAGAAPSDTGQKQRAPRSRRTRRRSTSFGSRIWGAVRERFASFIGYFRAPEPTPTKSSSRNRSRIKTPTSGPISEMKRSATASLMQFA